MIACLLIPGLRAESGIARAPAVGSRPCGARAGGRRGAAPRAGDGRGGGGGGEAGDAARRGARDVSVARARRPRPGCGRAGVGGRLAAPRGHGLRGRPGRPGNGRVRDERRRAPLRRRAAGARTCARSGRVRMGSSRRRGWQALHRPRGGERRAARSDPAGGGEGGRGVPRAAPALPPADGAQPLRGAGRARAAVARRARAAARRRGRGAAGDGGENGLAARARRPEGTRAGTQARLGARRGDRPSRKRLRTSSRCDGRSAHSSSACSRVQNGPGGRFENSRWSPGSSTAAPGGA